MSKKLLLADDSITIQKVIGITFANEDYDLTVVDNGDSALEKARAVRPDLILADVFMPGRNGYELAAAVKQDPSLQGVPVLLLAGTFEPFDEDKARNSGADGWIAKPFESQTLIDRVEELLALAPRPAEPVEEPVVPMAMPEAMEAEAEWGEAFDLAEEGAVSSDEDLWGSVSFGEEDLAVESEEEVFVSEEEPLDLAEEPSSAVPEAVTKEEDFLFEEEPLSLAEAPAVGEEPMGQTFAPTTEEEPFVFEEEPFALAEETPGEISGVEGEEEEFVFEEESFELAEESPVGAFDAAVAEEEAFLFEEEPLEVMEETPSGEEPQEEPFAPAAKEETFVSFNEEPAEEEPAAMWEESEEEILALDEADILEEEELGDEAAPVVEGAFAPEEDVWGWEEPAEPLEAAPAEAVLGESEPAAAVQQAVEDDFSFVEEGPEWGVVGEPEPGEEEPFGPLEEEPLVAPQAPAPEAAPASAAPVALEAQVRSLSEEELAEVVEKVAGTVIERLANTVLEKIAWEVVPDLAESLIKDELRKIKEEAGTGH